MSDFMNLRQQEEPADDSPMAHTAKKISLFNPRHVRIPSKVTMPSKDQTRKQAIHDAERLLKITESKVSLTSSRDNQPEIFQRSFYGEELNENVINRGGHKRDSRGSIASF
jgi:hypothetical protein